MARANVIVDCQICQKNSYTVPGADLDGMTRPEIIDALGPMVKKQGWAERKHIDARIGRYFVCPECIAGEAKTVKALAPYDENAKCPKCGFATLSTTWSTGLELNALLPVEHLARKCARCAYSFAQAPADVPVVSVGPPGGH